MLLPLAGSRYAWHLELETEVKAIIQEIQMFSMLAHISNVIYPQYFNLGLGDHIVILLDNNAYLI